MRDDLVITDLLNRAKAAIEVGEKSLRAAAEDMAAAQDRGVTQREIAQFVGKSPAWVNRLLKWRETEYSDATPFGPQSKANRQRAERVQSAERSYSRTSDRAQADAERARAEAAKAEAARARAEAMRARAEAEKAEADARAAREREKARREERSFQFKEGPRNAATLNAHERERLVKFLGMLGSQHDGERASAALKADQQRKALGLTWDDLIVPASNASARAA